MQRVLLDLAQRTPAFAEDDLNVVEAAAEAIKALKKPYREVMHALLIEQKPAPEISKVLQTPLNTIYQQIFRGTEQLRKVLARTENNLLTAKRRVKSIT